MLIQNPWRNVIYWFVPHHQGNQEETKGRNLEAGTEVEAMEEPLLAGTSCTFILISYSTQSYLPKVDTNDNDIINTRLV